MHIALAKIDISMNKQININKTSELIITTWKGVKVIHKPALLKDNLVLLFLVFRHDYTTMFTLDFPRIVYTQRCVVSKIMFLKDVRFTTFEFS